MVHRVLTVVIISLFAIGLIFTLFKNPLSVIIPVTILGVIVYFLRRPHPRFSRRGPMGEKPRSHNPHPATQRSPNKRLALKLKANAPDLPEKHKRTTKKRQHAFRVIEGKKGKTPPADNSDDKHLLH